MIVFWQTLINRSFFIGIYGRALVTGPSYDYTLFDSDQTLNIELKQQAFFGHGGLLLGYVFMPTKPFHFGISTRFGIGAITLFDDYSQGGTYHSN